jgi:hypothetical protein
MDGLSNVQFIIIINNLQQTTNVVSSNLDQGEVYNIMW